MPHGQLHKKKLKKNLIVLAAIVFFIALIWGVTMIKIKNASAAEIYECGKATSFELNTETDVGFCDMYTRQFAYRDDAIEFRKDIMKRAINFAKPSKKASQQYKEDIEKLHDSIDEDNIPSIFVYE